MMNQHLRPLILGLCALTAQPALMPGADAVAKPTPPKIIFDTDMATDCDDAGALAILHALADNGECEILATMVSSGNPWSAPAVDAINTYYGRPELPIGTAKGDGPRVGSSYAQRLAGEFPHHLRSGDDAPDAAGLYRDILEKQPDQSIIIVTVGYLINLKNLLQLPAGAGHSSGQDIIGRKVK